MIAAFPLLDRRYRLIQELGSGGMGAVYRAVDRLTDTPIAIKSLIPQPDQWPQLDAALATQHRLSLAREFQLLSSLRHPHIVSVTDYGFDRHGIPYYAMELLEGTVTILEFGAGQPSEVVRSLFAQMMEALAYLHRRQLLHRDLKPENILVTPDGTVKLLDFGLAVYRKVDDPEEEEASGTILYMAPELFRQGRPSIASDLYAAGLITFQLLTGAYPYRLDGSLTTLVDDILHHMPSLQAPSIDPVFRPILTRMLQKDPKARYRDVREALVDLYTRQGIALPAETQVVRESYLQAAPFVGREAELQQLNAAIDRVREASAGSAWLVGGESGVGKSRLLNELRTIALVKGLAVFSGTAAAEGGPSNMLWRDVLRRVALYTDLSDTEAGVLKPLVPDIERLIERDVPPAPEIDPATARSRLFSVVIDVLRRQERPVLLLFENLHWVQDDILLTNRVLQEVDGLPVVIVGSYQDDERPGLPDELPTMTLIRLRRFETEQIAQLARAMLGDSTARQPDLITLLEKETDGNILFIVEVLRALAEDAGGLAAIGSSPLPAATLTAGIETIVQRRLQRVPRVFRPLLEFAAVAGREVDDKLLRYYAVEADEFLLLCADYHILEVRENQWRFIHERLREGAAAALSDAERQAVHAEVARAIEAVYGSTHHTIPMLAYHWNRAQDIAREVQYAARAAVQAVERHAYQEAIPWLERALELADLQGWEPIRRARLARQLAQCYQLGLSRSLKSIEYLERALGYLGQKKPDGQGELTQRLMIEAARQVLRRAGFRRQAPRSEIDRIQMIGQIAQSLAGDYMTYTHDYRRGFFYAVCGINQLEMTMDRRNLASSYAQMAFTLMYAGRPGLSRYYGRRAQQVITAIDAEDQAVANVFSLLTYYETFTGHFDHAERLGKRAQEIFVKLGSHGSGMVINFHLAIAAELEGRYEDALHYRQAHQQDTAFTQALHAQVWTGAGVGQIKALQGRLDEALDIFLERSRLIDSLDLTTSTRWTYIALVYWRLGDHDRAEGYLNQAMEEVTRIRQPDPHDVYAIFNTAEVAFGLWEADPANRERRARASVALGYVRRYGHAYPVGRPFALIYDGIDQWITGQPTKATRLWRKAAQEAADLGIPLAEAIACWQLGRQGIGDLKQRRDHLTRAAAILERIGAQWHHQQVQAAAEGIAQPVSGSAPGAD